jgi:hypothetical protein
MGLGHSPRIVTDGLVLCLDAANARSYPGTGTTWADLTKNTDVSLTNSISFTSENSGSFIFDGTNDRIDVPLSSNIVPNGDFSLVFWFYLLSTSDDYPRLFSVGNNDYLEISVRSNGDVKYYKRNGGGWQVVGLEILNTSDWNNLVYVRDGSNDFFYLDSSRVYSQSGGAHPYNSNINEYKIGSRYTNGEAFTYGNISTFIAYNKALTADEIRRNFEATKGRYE